MPKQEKYKLIESVSAYMKSLDVYQNKVLQVVKTQKQQQVLELSNYMIAMFGQYVKDSMFCIEPVQMTQEQKDKSIISIKKMYMYVAACGRILTKENFSEFSMSHSIINVGIMTLQKMISETYKSMINILYSRNSESLGKEFRSILRRLCRIIQLLQLK